MTAKRIPDVLPPLPPSLKSISSYIQRAEELRTKDPVMAYWCTYYAAQLGLDLKSHEPGVRDYLYALITLLEEMKKGLIGNDAVESEAAGAAYVENFALKVFALADNEDRKGEISRSTAKKFLAAANFLELLKVFEKSNNAEVNEEKVRYAKWKASDIAKAFREGRKPTPGAAQKDGFTDITPTARSPADRSPLGQMPLELSPEPTSPNMLPRTPPSALKRLPGAIDVPPNEVSSPGAWSTIATPGSETAGPSSSSASAKLAFASAMNRWRDQNAVDVTMPTPTRPGQNDLAQARGTIDPDTSSRKVHFSPSVVGGLSSTDGSPPTSPGPEQSAPTGSGFYNGNAPGVQSPNIAPAGTSIYDRQDPAMTPLPESSPSGSSLTSPVGTPPQTYNVPSGKPRSGSSPRDLPVKLGGSPPGVSGTTRSSPPRSRSNSLQPSTLPPPPVPPFYSAQHERRSSVSNRHSPPATRDPQSHPYSPNTSNSPGLASSATLTSPVSGRANGSPNRAPVPGLPPVTSSQPMSNVYGTNYPPKQPSPPIRYVVPAPEPAPSVVLTSALISKAQKHCRYAISALEYEDDEQARKELRAALALLGDR